MRLRPDVVGRVERRILLDHAVDPEVAARRLPEGLTLRLLDGRAIVGVCLVRLVELRPAGLPAAVGRTVEAAAHRISVVGPGGEAGVFVPRRDTTSRAAVVAGGRIWPGVHGPARIDAARTTTNLAVAVRARDGVAVAVTVDRDEHRGTVLPDPVAAATFHAVERTAWSPGRRGRLEVAVMECTPWSARPVGVVGARSTWIDGLGPPGSADLLGALLMEDVAVRWRDGRDTRTTVPTWPPRTTPTRPRTPSTPSRSGPSWSSTSAPSTPS